MTSLSDIREKLLDTQAFISRLEQRLSVYPDSEQLIGNLRSAQKRRRTLEQAFATEASKVKVDVCSYRLFTEEGAPSIAALSKVLGYFQTLFSLVYDALKNGPKKRSRLSKEIVNETSLGFGYVFSGSVGMVMTLPKERLLSGGARFDESMKLIFQMAKAANANEMAAFVAKIGRPPVKAIYDWAKAHEDHDLGSDIEWIRQEQVKSKLFIQKPELEALRSVVDETIALTLDHDLGSDIERKHQEQEKSRFFVQRPGPETLGNVIVGTSGPTEEVEVVGNLVGVDVHQRTFHIRSQAGSDITGRFADAIDAKHTVELPKPYRAKLRKTMKIADSIAEEAVEYFLIDLLPLRAIPEET